MEEKRDILGRRIPQFDRSAVGKRNAEEYKRKYGEDYYSRIGAVGGKHRKRGHFGRLKDAGKEVELKILSAEGHSYQKGHFKELKDAGRIRELRRISKKGGSVRARDNKPISRGRP